MTNSASVKRTNLVGVALAVLAVIIWSGNFVVARGVIRQIPPGTLAFFRWVTAALIIAPFALRDFRREWPVVKRSMSYLFWVSLSGITLFNTFVYIGAHYTTAINLSLIGTTSSPIMVVILARIFLKEKIDLLKMVGMSICIAGVIFLLSRGDWHNLLSLQFTAGDGWVLLGAFSFAVYNTLVRKKPSGISTINFLFVIFSLGSLLLIPFFIWDTVHHPAVLWTPNLVMIILFLGLGTSVISYLCWNTAIARLGAGRTALFGNLIPVFSSFEAALILHEQLSWVHVAGMILVFAGIVVANWKLFR